MPALTLLELAERIGAHLKNITTILVNPFEAVGYKQ